MIRLTSPATTDYTCVSWAFNDKNRVWWPDGDNYWPIEPPLIVTIDTFIETFTLDGYEQCDSYSLENGFQKIAIFGKTWDEPSHVARQLSNGTWASKLGPQADIEHDLGVDLNCDIFLKSYGPVRVIMKKRAQPQNPMPIDFLRR